MKWLFFSTVVQCVYIVQFIKIVSVHVYISVFLFAFYYNPAKSFSFLL